jgi:uncharacterized protein YndB with AHSA1/START domain
MAENITVSDIIPARPERVFAAWLDPVEHGKMTGGAATDEGGGAFTAWDGYIEGRTLTVSPNKEIVQAWRTTEFPDGAPDSTLTVRFEPASGGTKVTLVHENIPDGQGDAYKQGWHEHYFTPMKAHFASPAEKMREAGEKLGVALEEATARAKKQATRAVREVQREVKKVQRKASAQVKQVQKRASAEVTKLGKQVKALVAGKGKAKPKAAAKRPTKPARKPAKKAAPKRSGKPGTRGQRR